MRVVPRTSPLPIDAILPEVVSRLAEHASLVIEAAAGAGKTTRVPPALLGAFSGQILVLEPRRIAARLAARRVAWEMGEEPGATVGYQVRFERVASAATRLHFLTEGVLTRRLNSDRELQGVDAVILDEFHERHLETDLALALLKRLQRRRPELRLVVMSATLDAAPVAEFLGGCPVVRSEGRQFPLEVEHLPYSPAPLETQVAGAVEQLEKDGHAGDTLVFLPGAAEIRRAMRACAAVARRGNLLLLPLHGDLTPAEQDRVVAQATQRKLILATNVAESSVTIDGVTAVVDSGLARRASYSPWTGLPTLSVARVSKASARQRAGRAGRTAPGRVLRLYTQADFQQRPEYDAPEVARGDLAQLCLALRAMGIGSPRELEWLDAPPDAAVESAEKLLDRLGAEERAARELMRYPLHPRLARLLIAAKENGAAEAGCRAAALLGSGARAGSSDLLEALDQPMDERTRRQWQQLRKLAGGGGDSREDEPLLRALLAAFPDRVGRRRSETQALLSTGVAAEFAGAAPRAEFFVALDVEDRSDRALPVIRLTARIEPEWLIDLFAERVREESGAEWNRQAERADAMSRLIYDELVLQESHAGAPEEEAAGRLLAAKALEAGIARFVDPEAMELWLGRMEFAGFEPAALETVFGEFCRGMRSFAELKNAGAGFLPWLEERLGARRLRELAPLTLKLQAGRQTKVHYERGKTPWIASRLQDFFGMTETPRLGLHETPVVLHLLAPNQRPVQTTTDLAGFWERLYPEVRRELMRRYPRHKWPERHDA